jgi:hypothetical protein
MALPVLLLAFFASFMLAPAGLAGVLSGISMGMGMGRHWQQLVLLLFGLVSMPLC